MSTAMSFCPECSNLLYPREDPDRRQLMFLCRQCDFARYAEKDDREENCVDRQNFNYKSKEDIYISADLAKDPTLGRVPHWRCRKCHHRGAVFYQLPERVAEDAMALVYVCLTPGCGEIEIQLPSSSSSASLSSSALSSDAAIDHHSPRASSEAFLGVPSKREEVQLQQQFKEQHHDPESEGKYVEEGFREIAAAAVCEGGLTAKEEEEKEQDPAAAVISDAPFPVGGGVAAFFQEEETAPAAAAAEEEEEEEEEEEDLFGEEGERTESYSSSSLQQQKAAEENMYLGADVTAGGEEREEEEEFYDIRRQQQLEEEVQHDEEGDEEDEDEEIHEETHFDSFTQKHQ